jgi:hypothetical protein
MTTNANDSKNSKDAKDSKYAKIRNDSRLTEFQKLIVVALTGACDGIAKVVEERRPEPACPAPSSFNELANAFDRARARLSADAERNTFAVEQIRDHLAAASWWIATLE